MSTFATGSSTGPRQPPGDWSTSTIASSSMPQRPSSQSSFAEGAADVVDRCLLDSMHDEVFILQAIKSLPPEVQADIKKALRNMEVLSLIHI